MSSLGSIETRQVAASAACDARTVERYLKGETVRVMVRERIEKALREQGLEKLVRREKETTTR